MHQYFPVDMLEHSCQLPHIFHTLPVQDVYKRQALYSLDSEDSAALTMLPQSATLQVLKANCGRDGTWARVLYVPTDAPAQLTGYVRMAQLNTER